MGDIVMTSPHSLSILIVLVSACLANGQSIVRISSGPSWSSVSAAPSKQPHQPSTLNVLLVGDTTDDKIGTGVQADLARMSALFQSSIPNGVQLQISTLHGSTATKSRILSAISASRTTERDTYVFYWSGHGAYDDHGHYLNLPDRKIAYRTEILRAIERLHPRLTVMMTDSCNNWHTAVRLPVRHTAYHPGSATNTAAKNSLFAELFLKPRGTVDINSASNGQVALISDNGSLFTFLFCSNLDQHALQNLSWRSFSELVDADLSDGFDYIMSRKVLDGSQKKSYDCQAVKVWSLPTDDRGLRLGAAVSENWGDGVQVMQVWAGYPATRLRGRQRPGTFALQPHDVILAINGQNIHSTRDFKSAVTGSPQSMTLTFRQRGTGLVRTLESTLRY